MYKCIIFNDMLFKVKLLLLFSFSILFNIPNLAMIEDLRFKDFIFKLLIINTEQYLISIK
jgi:hypothetical protein